MRTAQLPAAATRLRWTPPPGCHSCRTRRHKSAEGSPAARPSRPSSCETRATQFSPAHRAGLWQEVRCLKTPRTLFPAASNRQRSSPAANAHRSRMHTSLSFQHSQGYTQSEAMTRRACRNLFFAILLVSQSA